ncbi:sigma-70 family RNA polymerase sigma factor [uncultured Castellaniella sp.]|uniref:RNA polymerase sigma factor n=1 Tax=uncultured Castellaniella sp. TaxID=647907 RepID=UPI00261B5FEF|nr:sigma-70 family RNA polymerase sigma factor [uncultured Castellaniella sp.]
MYLCGMPRPELSCHGARPDMELFALLSVGAGVNADADLEDVRHAVRASAGDARAYSWLVMCHQGPVYRYLVRLVRVPETARELTQDTFLRAFQAIPTWRPEARFRTWLFRIAHNLALDHLRRAKHVRLEPLEAGADVPDPAPGPERRLETAQRMRRLEQALAALAPAHREVLLLREIEEMSYEDIARALDLNLGTVRSRIARARAALLAVLRT